MKRVLVVEHDRLYRESIREGLVAGGAHRLSGRGAGRIPRRISMQYWWT